MERTTDSNAGPTSPQSFAPNDGEAGRRHMEAARFSLRELGALAAGAGSSLSGETVTVEVKRILTELEGFAGEAPAIPRVPCDFCGRLIMPAATLCGFCWHARSGRAADRVATAGPSVSQT